MTVATLMAIMMMNVGQSEKDDDSDDSNFDVGNHSSGSGSNNIRSSFLVDPLGGYHGQTIIPQAHRTCQTT